MKISEVYVRYNKILIVWQVRRDSRLTLYASAPNVCNALRQVFLMSKTGWAFLLF